MERKWMIAATVAVLVFAVGTGCSKKKPKTMAPEEIEVPSVPVQTQEVPPPPTMPPDQTPITDEELMRMTREAYESGLLGDVYYDFDKYDLRPEARERLARNAEYMRSNPSLVFAIEGHCDERGTSEYNLALGDRRASAASNYLGSLGIDSSRLTTISYGEERPQCSNSNEGCWQQNRRAHFVITGAG